MQLLALMVQLQSVTVAVETDQVMQTNPGGLYECDLFVN